MLKLARNSTRWRCGRLMKVAIRGRFGAPVWVLSYWHFFPTMASEILPVVRATIRFDLSLRESSRPKSKPPFFLLSLGPALEFDRRIRGEPNWVERPRRLDDDFDRGKGDDQFPSLVSHSRQFLPLSIGEFLEHAGHGERLGGHG